MASHSCQVCYFLNGALNCLLKQHSPMEVITNYTALHNKSLITQSDLSDLLFEIAFVGAVSVLELQ